MQLTENSTSAKTLCQLRDLHEKAYAQLVCWLQIYHLENNVSIFGFRFNSEVFTRDRKVEYKRLHRWIDMAER